MPEIGLLLPCNVLVREDEAGSVHVSFMDPESVLGMVKEEGVGPLAEELVFRGYLVRVLERRFPTTPVPALASSLLFGLAHERWIAAALCGLAFYRLRRRAGLGAAMVAHAVANALLFLTMLAA